MEKYEINKYLEKFLTSVNDLRLALDESYLKDTIRDLNEQVSAPDFWLDSKNSNKVIGELNVLNIKTIYDY